MILMTNYRQMLQIVFLAVFTLNTLVFVGIGIAMPNEMTPAAMQSMNDSDCDGCTSDNQNCEPCVLACFAPFALVMNDGPSLPVSASLRYKIGDREKYRSYISLLDPFPPQALPTA